MTFESIDGEEGVTDREVGFIGGEAGVTRRGVCNRALEVGLTGRDEECEVREVDCGFEVVMVCRASRTLKIISKCSKKKRDCDSERRADKRGREVGRRWDREMARES